jgi:fructose-bisphosphate aldolase class 1
MLRGRRRAAAGLGEAISGCIMFEETLYQDAADGKPFVDVLKAQGILPGIKVDTGDLYSPPRLKCTPCVLKGQGTLPGDHGGHR